MTNKQKKTSQAEGLSSALRPPKRRDSHITSLLDRFADDEGRLSSTDNLSPDANLSVSDNQSLDGNLSLNTTPSPDDNLSFTDKLPGVAPLAYQESNLSLGDNPPRTDNHIDLWSSIPVVRGHTRFWHMITDHLYQHLDSFEQAVYTQLYRLSWGYGKETCNISNGRLAERANLKLTVTRRAIRDLESKGLIQKISYTWGKKHAQGIEYRIPLPDMLSRAGRLSPEDNLPPGGPIKEINTQKEITQTQTGVSASSRFSLAECRRYAEHLQQTRQGITNPGGYATKIFRSGEADAFIEAFLNLQTPLDISKCPACQGSNFVYLDSSNPDLGVRPCRHEELLNQNR